MVRARGLIVAVIAATLLPVPASADAIEDFYRGRVVEILVGSDAGGGFDIVARVVGAHIGRHIPGAPDVVVKNMPGAGSRRAAAHLHTQAAKDGSVIGAIFPGAIMEAAIKGTEAVRYDPRTFVYLGSPETGTNLCIVSRQSPAKTFAEARDKEVILGATQAGGSTRDFALFLNGLFGAKFKLVSGYPGSREISLAIERNEVQGVCGLNWSSFKSQRPDWVRDRTMIYLIQYGLKPHPELAPYNVTFIGDLVKTEAERQAVDFFGSQLAFARPYLLPPGTPADRVAALRAAFDRTMADPAFRSAAEKASLEIEPESGIAMQDRVAAVFATPREVIDRVARALDPGR
ncbi:MAG: hypothetical protein FJX67_00210 [Alphaproteobacteria bacterium]|nr:hypothetical protein [Alphaproteobacteria bacterium]